MIMAPKMQVLPYTPFDEPTRHVNAPFREYAMLILKLVSGAVLCSALGVAMITAYVLIVGSILFFSLVVIASRGVTFAKSRNETDMSLGVAS